MTDGEEEGDIVSVEVSRILPMLTASRCQRCQLRKIKCTRVYPCASCTLAGQDCIFRADDRKRRPVGRNYVAAVEGQLSQYQSLLRKLKAASEEERSALLDSVALDEEFPPFHQSSGSNDPSIDALVSSRLATMSLQPGAQGSLLFHGPTSMYQRDVPVDKPQEARNLESRIDIERWQMLKVPPQGLDVDDRIIKKALSLFFLYQYPQFMFVYREAFLEDYFENSHLGKYFSYPLLYAICALGVRASPDAKIRETGNILSHYAETFILSQALSSPHITIAQALLCLAFYELGAGEHSKGWLLAGMAFRMSQDLGLHQDPKFLVSQDSTIASNQDLVIRRRVYYGLYVSDKIISLYLGRPVMLSEGDNAVDLPEPLPDFPPGHDWYGLFELTESDLGQLSGTVLVPSFEGLIELGKITEEILSKLFSTKMAKKSQKDLLLSRSSRLEELSVRLGRWHSSLPIHLKWNQWNPTPGNLKPHVLNLQSVLPVQAFLVPFCGSDADTTVSSLFYHSILISLNRHFVKPTPGFSANTASKETCIASVDAIIALIREFRSQQGLGCSPVLVVYSAVMAGSGLFFIQDSTALTLEKDIRLSFILKVLEECSQTLKLAAEALTKLRANIDTRRTATTGGQMQETAPYIGDRQSEMTDVASKTWMDGNMFDSGAFDLGEFDLSAFDSSSFGALNPLSFGDVEGDLTQGFTALPGDWLSNEPSANFQLASSSEYYPPPHTFDFQDYDVAKR